MQTTHRREKLFGYGRPVPLDRNAKVRVMVLARALSRRTEPGRAYGDLTAKALAVLEALLWGFHNAHTGRCFPSYEAIADRTGCARSTVAAALKALERAGIMTWCNRIVRVRERCADLFGQDGWRWRVVRTSNAYAFTDPGSKSEKPTGTSNQDTNSLPLRHVERPQATDEGLAAALDRLGKAVVSHSAVPVSR